MGVVYFLLIYFFPVYALPITAVVWVVFAQAHFGSTWFIYFDKKNREYYRQHPIIYYVMPFVVAALVLALRMPRIWAMIRLTSAGV